MRSCRACGAPAPDEARFCPTCGTNYEAPQAPTGTTPGWTSGSAPPTPVPSPVPGAPAPAPWTLPPATRPLGVTIMTLWNIAAGLLGIVLGLGLLAAGPSMLQDPDFRAQVERDLAGVPGSLDLVAGALVGVGLYFALTGGAMVATGYGMWKARPWARTGMLILALFWLLGSLLAFPVGLLGAALAGFLLWYFSQEGVKRWFERAEAQHPGLPGYVPPPSSPPPM